MFDDVKPRRRYTSVIRQEQARETRRRLLDAAHQLFLTHGYVATTMETIAREAGVSVQTVYATFGNKRTLLARLLDLAIGGDEAPLGILERPGPQAMRQEHDQLRQLRLLAHGIAEVLERAGPLFEVLRSAAAVEPEVTALYQRVQAERLRNMRRVVEWVVERGPLRPGLTVAVAADTVWTLTSADVHRLLTSDRGWSGTEYEQWLGETLISLLLG